MPRIFLDLPRPTSTNRMHAPAGSGKRRSDEYEAWRTAAGWEIAAARPRMPVRALPAGCRWRSRIRISVDDRIDADNPVKPLHDLLVSLRIVPDDRNLWGGSYCRSASVPKGRIHVWIWSIGSQ
jgi:Holliday junction resolvase RusA-like endonuclease